MNVFGAEIAAFRADQDGIDRIGVAFGKFQLRLGRQILVVRDADDQRIAARDCYGRRWRGVVLFVLEVAALLLILLAAAAAPAAQAARPSRLAMRQTEFIHHRS